MPRAAPACNCTVCRRYGVLWIYGHVGEDVRVTGPTSQYIREDHLEFHFCSTCGCVVNWRGRHAGEDGRRRIAVNLRLAEPDGIGAIPIRHFDGLVTFQPLPSDGCCVADIWF